MSQIAVAFGLKRLDTGETSPRLWSDLCGGELDRCPAFLEIKGLSSTMVPVR